MSFSIDGKTVIVTGAANGIGAALARHFAENGANVMCADIDEKSLKKDLGETAEDSNVRYFAGDLREKLTLANLLSATVDAFDRVDVLVNASRQMATTDPLDMDDETVEKLLQQNLMTSLRLSQMVAKRMIKGAGSRVRRNNYKFVFYCCSINSTGTFSLFSFNCGSRANDAFNGCSACKTSHQG